MGAALSTFETSLGGGDYALSSASFASSVEVRRDERTYQLVLGSVLSGTLVRPADRLSVGPGVLAGVSGSTRLYTQARTGLFVLGTASFAASSSQTSAGPLRAFDARVGVAAGRTFGPVTPYLLARLFGGPVLLPGGTTVGDDRHFVLGLGVSARVGPFDLGGEIAPLGERRATAACGVSF